MYTMGDCILNWILIEVRSYGIGNSLVGFLGQYVLRFHSENFQFPSLKFDFDNIKFYFNMIWQFFSSDNSKASKTFSSFY